MKRELLSKAFGDIDESFVSEAYRPVPMDASSTSERIVHMKRKRIVSLALAAALILALGVTAYAVWSIHSARQQEIKADLKIDENNVSSYTEYDVDEPKEQEEEETQIVLLSSVNDGDMQRIYMNISPVTEAEVAVYNEDYNFFWSIEGTEKWGLAKPKLPSDITLIGNEEIQTAVRQYAYNRDTQTITLECRIDVSFIEEAENALGTDTIPLKVDMKKDGNVIRTYGSVSFTHTEDQTRYFDFGHALYHDEDLDKEIEVVGLELTPFSAVWKVRYEGAESFHTPEADWEKYAPWSALEDKVGMESLLVFSDGSSFSTGGALTTPCNNGVVELHCGWGSAINIDDVQRIVLDDLVLWENK